MRYFILNITMTKKYKPQTLQCQRSIRPLTAKCLSQKNKKCTYQGRLYKILNIEIPSRFKTSDHLNAKEE